MNTLRKVCAILFLTSIAVFGVSAQDQRDTPGKDHTPKVKVEKDKVEDKQQNRDRDKENKNPDNNRDKGNKKPGI